MQLSEGNNETQVLNEDKSSADEDDGTLTPKNDEYTDISDDNSPEN